MMQKTPKDQKPPQSAVASADDAEPSNEGDYAEIIGAFKDDPMLDAMMENIRQRRREVDADGSIE